MKQFVSYSLVAMLFCTPVAAQDTPEGPEGDVQEGIDLLEEGAKLFLRGFLDDIEPALEEFAQNMKPAMRELMGMIDDFDAYHLPEVLPNGDIIIRRKIKVDPPAEGEIDI